MLNLLITAALLAAVQAPTPAPEPEPAAPAAPRYQTQLVRLQTSAGPIVLEVEAERAPVTSANFLRYVNEGRLNGATFYRAVKVGDGYGLLQGGVRNDPKRVLPPIAHEPTSKTGLSHLDGAISMARAEPGTASGDFFITVGDLNTMDARPSQAGDAAAGYAVFGRVVEGMDVVRSLLEAPRSVTLGEGVMRGQMLETPVVITVAERADAEE
jgi:peptidyl-prolyl cis-trans isomerase A (cyclophilin A)